MRDVTAPGEIIHQKPAVMGESLGSIDDEYEPERGEYYLDEFGKLELNYNAERIGVFAGLNGTTFVLMTVGQDLIVFII